ncbi:Nn.00g079140.m01.CDS01 [Neocucurbitaria sp. VM-36]
MEYSTVPKAFQGDQAHRPFVERSDALAYEPPKAAINAYLSKKELVVHLFGIVMTGVVVGVNAFSVYWVDLGNEGKLSTSASLKYLQFVAKIHEIVMMASISSVLLFILHRRLLKKGIPFGFLDAPYMIGAGGGAGLLITKRFWSPRRQSPGIFIALLLWIAFAFALNPASSIAMIPSLAHWPVKAPYGKGNEFKIYFQLPLQLPGSGRMPSPWPTGYPKDGWPIRNAASCFDANATEEVDCPAGGMEQIINWLSGNILLGSSTNFTMQEATNFQRVVISQPLRADGLDFTRNVLRRLSTTPTFLSTTALGGFWAYLQSSNNNGTLAKKVLTPVLQSKEGSATSQPIVYSQCYSEVFNVNSTGISDVAFEVVRAPWEKDENISHFSLSPDAEVFQNLPSL